MLKSDLIQLSIKNANAWETTILKRHNDATHPIHSLEILAEFGLTESDSGISDICNKILSHQSPEGSFQSNILVPKTFKGPGVEKWDWMSCDAPILLYFLSKMGIKNTDSLKRAAMHLKSLVRENGLGCNSSIPKFRGPGRKSDHCPYANLLALKALRAFSDRCKDEIQHLIDAQVNFWENRKTRKLYLFGMGTKFKKLKYPNIYYNIVHVLDVLSLYPEAQETNAFHQMIEIVNSKQRKDGSFIPESIWRAFKNYDFGQKKLPSPTLTYKIAEINHRCGLLFSQ
ncbi:MAG: hypothetical protein ACTSW1_09765 [Candidatus Hodarchaeales archaeon]